MPTDTKERGKWAWARWGDYNNLCALLDLLGWKTLGVALLTNLGAFAWIWEPGNRPITVLTGLLIVIVVSCLSIWWQVKHGQRKSAEQTIPSLIIDAQPGIEFFATIDELRSRHPLPETFKPKNEIHAYFLSGEGVFAESSEYIKCIKRLILPLPNDTNIAALRRINGAINYESQIMTYANNVREHDKNSVRFYADFLGASFLFCNPLRQDAWVQIGIILPGTESRERPHFRVYRSHNENAFLSIYGTFNRLWDASSRQTAEEDMQEGFDSARP